MAELPEFAPFIAELKTFLAASGPAAIDAAVKTATDALKAEVADRDTTIAQMKTDQADTLAQLKALLPVTVVTTAITAAAQEPLSGQLQADNGTGPYTWSVTGAPADITFNADGTYSGTPAAGTETIQAVATDSAGVASAPASIVVTIT